VHVRRSPGSATSPCTICCRRGVGLLECVRRLGVALNTVKRYARAEALRRPPHYRRTLVDSYRDHLRRRLAEQPGISVTHLQAEIREQGYPGSANLLVRRALGRAGEGPRQRLRRCRPSFTAGLQSRPFPGEAEIPLWS